MGRLLTRSRSPTRFEPAGLSPADRGHRQGQTSSATLIGRSIMPSPFPSIVDGDADVPPFNG
ncbi:hypothetical protein CRG98_034863 [Punica granatum]|uniref:Uncharacterized protein n=1 Tax=Punica granatum TaxID=22663 RepID=A0A2I0IL74_PUNGR|nr:hypothetical protein CRG98_034863 [Punica granatum]